MKTFVHLSKKWEFNHNYSMKFYIHIIVKNNLVQVIQNFI